MTLLKALLVLCISVVALPARADDMQKYLADTREMVRQGKYPQAAERFVWFHEHALQHQPSMSGVRLSFALGDWKALGDVYPPAKVAMVEMRNRQSNQFINQDKSAELFQDVAALNRTLKEDDETVEIFRWLDQTQPGVAKECWSFAKQAVLDAKQYELAGKYIGDPVREFDLIEAIYEQGKAFSNNRPATAIIFNKVNEERLIEESLQLIDLALALEEPKAAKAIQEKALAKVDDRRLRKAIPAEGAQK